MEQLTTPYDLYVDLTEGTILVYVNGVPGTKIIQFYQNEGKTSVLNIHIRQQNDVLKLRNKTVRIAFKKPDDEIVWQPCEIVDANIGKVTVTLEEQTLVVPGDLAVQLQVSDADGRISESDVFYIRVHKSLMTGETIKSTSSLPLLENAVKTGELFKGYKVSDLAAIKPTADAAKKAVDDTNKIVDANSDRLTVLEKDMSKQDMKTQSLTHGPSIVNATVASPLNVEVQGRTLVNLLGQTTLDPAKYYLFMPNKGTTKITAGGSSYDGVAKFTGQSAIAYTIKQDFRDKVSKSTLENGHMQKANVGSTSLLAPSAFTSEETQWRYDRIKTLNVETNSESTGTNLCIAQILISFDVVRTLQDKFGIQIWQGKTTLADKVAIAKQLIVDYAAVLYANGSSPQGNKLYVKRWIPSTSTWFGSTTTTESNLTKVQTGSTNVQEIDSNGFIHVIAYADASDGTRPSVVNIDYAMLELKTKIDMDTPMLEDALYEVDQLTYNKINIDPEFAGQKLMDKFPYVEGVKHLNPVVVGEGSNLLPPFTDPLWKINGNAKIISPYELELDATSNYNYSAIKLPAIPNQAYTVTVNRPEDSIVQISAMDSKDQSLLTRNQTLVTPPGTVYLLIQIGNRLATGKHFFSNPILVLGDKVKTFVPQNKSYLYTNIKLAGYNGVNDVLYKEDGKWNVLRKLECEVVLDGAREWFLGTSYTDFKQFRYAHGLTNYVPLSGYTVKPTGKQMYNGNTSTAFDITSLNPNGTMYISVSNQDTGFGDTYQPVSDEVKAFFNGWKLKSADANGKPNAWISVVDGKDAPTQTLAYVKANRAPNYSPYKLTYQLATPRVENVQIEGDMIVDGITQINVDSGVIVREKVEPKKTTDYYINRADIASSRFKYKTSSILTVYKNGVLETRWSKTYTNAYGNEAICIEASDFDSKAEYTVTYLVLDKHQFTTNTTDVKVSYNQSVRSTVDELTVKQADTVTGLSILQNLMTDVLARLKANSL